MKQRNVVMQKYDYSCGTTALATILQYFWNDPVSEQQILNVLLKVLTPDEIKDRIEKGMAITDLRRVSVEMGYLSSIGTLTFDKLMEAKIPLIVPIRIKEYRPLRRLSRRGRRARVFGRPHTGQRAPHRAGILRPVEQETQFLWS